VLAGGIYERTSGAAGQPLRGGYQRREPEQTVLHELVSRHAQTMLAELPDADGRGLPRYVERELAEYLRCGILAHGFARVRCTTCHDEIVVAFSGKERLKPRLFVLPALAKAHAVNIQSVFDHYNFRAVARAMQADGKDVIAVMRDPKTWQFQWFEGEKLRELDFWLGS
jgi:hypothetical protein